MQSNSWLQQKIRYHKYLAILSFFYKYTTSENSSDSDCEMEVENTSLNHTVEYVLGIDFDFCLPTRIIYIV